MSKTMGPIVPTSFLSNFEEGSRAYRTEGFEKKSSTPKSTGFAHPKVIPVFKDLANVAVPKPKPVIIVKRKSTVVTGQPRSSRFGDELIAVLDQLGLED
jgi:hypothetical protein